MIFEINSSSEGKCSGFLPVFGSSIRMPNDLTQDQNCGESILQTGAIQVLRNSFFLEI